MPIRIVRLGSPRQPDEGTRVGTVRRPPRGVPKAEFGVRDYYDVWYPELAPSVDTMKLGQQAESTAEWQAFVKAYRHEMASPAAARSIALLAALSHSGNFSVGCYCELEAQCHRSVLRALLVEQGARIA
jgi:uncharacterized protein YeaO (DUF488 family)